MTMFMPKTSDLSEGETPDRAVKHEQRSASTVHAVLPPPPIRQVQNTSNRWRKSSTPVEALHR